MDCFFGHGQWKVVVFLAMVNGQYFCFAALWQPRPCQLPPLPCHRDGHVAVDIVVVVVVLLLLLLLLSLLLLLLSLLPLLLLLLPLLLVLLLPEPQQQRQRQPLAIFSRVLWRLSLSGVWCRSWPLEFRSLPAPHLSGLRGDELVWHRLLF